MDGNVNTAALFTVPREYGYVLIAAFLVGLLNFIHALLISRLRLRIQLPYPYTYATPTNCRRALSSKTSTENPSLATTFTSSTSTATPLLPTYIPPEGVPQGLPEYDNLTRLEYSFNCAQRAHVNYIENIATHLVALLASGLVYPKTASILAEGWCVGRCVYLYGYMTPEWGMEGEGRKWGVAWLGPICHYGLLLLSGWVGVEVVLGW